MSDLLTNPLSGPAKADPHGSLVPLTPAPHSPDQLTPDSLASDCIRPDLLTIDTPEQVSIRFPVAGIGSRFLAIVADTIAQGILYSVLALVLFLIAESAPRTPAAHISSTSEKWLIAIFILFNFLIYWGYFTLFEGLWNGQTPGKRLAKIRVIQASGRQLTFFESMTR